MLTNLNGYRIILASNSPRRRELLSGLDIAYEILTLPDIEESYPPHLQENEIPEYIASQKANAYSPLLDDRMLIITADTVVWLEGRLYGKPHDMQDACNMLGALSGKTHVVITAVCLTSLQKRRIFSVRSEVTFATLRKDEINRYVEKYSPLDKAGAYGVQEWIGYIGVEKISGSYYNVMGLPVQRLYRELEKW